MYQRKGRRISTILYQCRLLLTLISLPIIFFVLLKIFLPVARLPKIRENTDSSVCLIPMVPPNSAAYNRTTVRHINQCNDVQRVPPVQLLDNGTLLFQPNQFYKRRDCTAFEILRPSVLPTDRHVLRQLEAFDETNQIHCISSEYAMVACYDSWTETLQYSYHYRLLLDQDPIKKRIEYWKNDRSQRLPVNVMVLVLDSIAANDASRQLPLTMNFLKSDLNFVEFHKFHAVGEPTMLNVLPLLTGTSAPTTFEHRHWMDYWNNSFIWEKFENSHYVTSFIEDIPNVATFNYGFQAGFLTPPTDVYPRPLFTAWEMNKKESDKCIGDSSLWKYIFNMELQIFRQLNGFAPIFTIPWLTWPFHDYFGTLSVLDLDMLHFFGNLSSSKSILENSLIIVMADHGFHSGTFSNTHEGSLERRLPLFLIRIPEKLEEIIPNAKKIVLENSERVTSHYDVYQTLLHLAQMGTKNDNDSKTGNDVKNGTGRSLLKPIKDGRTCRDAQVPDGWCACNLPSPQTASNAMIAESVVLDVDPFHLLRIRDLLE